MPFYDSRDAPENVAAETRAESQAEIDRLTRLLCLAGRVWDGSGDITPELVEWWTKHREVDRKRRGK